MNKMRKELMSKSIIALATSCILTLSTSATANVSSTVNLTSDYTFNGVSQTSNNPALQVSVDYAADMVFILALGHPISILVVLMILTLSGTPT